MTCGNLDTSRPLISAPYRSHENAILIIAVSRAMTQCGARQNEARTAPCGQDCTSHSSANLIATRCMDGESKNAETYLPLPQPTRRRVCTGACVIHFILCGLPELGSRSSNYRTAPICTWGNEVPHETCAVRSAN